MAAGSHSWLHATSAFAMAVAGAAVFSSIAPRASVLLLVLVALAASALIATRFKSWIIDVKPRLMPEIASGGLLLVYAAFNASWALDPAAAAVKVASVGAIAALAAVVFAALRLLDEDAVKRVAMIFLAGAALGALAIAIEVASGQAITRGLFNLFPILRPEGGKGLAIDGSRVFLIAKYELNRNLALLILMFWPAIMVLLSQRTILMPKACAAGALMLIAVLAFSSEHETSMIALSASAAIWLASLARARLVGRVLMAAWCLAFLLIIPASHFAYHTAELHRASWLPSTARARIIIWGYTAERIGDQPLLGIGVRSTRVLDETLLPVAEREEGDVFARRPGRHAHNLFLQAWFELGLIGAGLVMVFGITILRRIAAIRDDLQPHAHALFTAFGVFASFAWGMWQTWLLAAYALSALYLALALRFAEGQARLPQTIAR